MLSVHAACKTVNLSEFCRKTNCITVFSCPKIVQRSLLKLFLREVSFKPKQSLFLGMLGIDQLPLKKKIKKWRHGVRLNKIFRLKTLLNNIVLEIYHKEFKGKYLLQINLSYLFGVELFVSALEWDQIKNLFWGGKRGAIWLNALLWNLFFFRSVFLLLPLSAWQVYRSAAIKIFFLRVFALLESCTWKVLLNVLIIRSIIWIFLLHIFSSGLY